MKTSAFRTAALPDCHISILPQNSARIDQRRAIVIVFRPRHALPARARRMSESSEAARLAHEDRRLRVAWFASTLALFAFLGSYGALSDARNAQAVWALAFGLAALPGKYTIFSGLSSAVPLGPWALCLLAILVDLVLSSSLALFLGLLARWPFAARRLKDIHGRAEGVLTQYPRLRRMAFFGTVLFVYLPLPASGSIGGTFLGQLVGLTRTATVAAVVLGGALVGATFAWLATTIGAKAEALAQDPWIVGAALAGFAVFAWLAWRRLKQALRS